MKRRTRKAETFDGWVTEWEWGLPQDGMKVRMGDPPGKDYLAVRVTRRAIKKAKVRR